MSESTHRIVIWVVFSLITVALLSCGKNNSMTNSHTSTQWTVQTHIIEGGQLQVISGFIGPYGVTVQPDGSMYVSDLKEGRVVRFNSDLVATGWLGMVEGLSGSESGWHTGGVPAQGTDTGMFRMAHSVDFNALGDIFVADYQNGRVHKYSPDGGFLGLFFAPPTRPELAFQGCPNATFDRDFNLWVSDFDAHRVFKFDPDGNLIGWLGETASGQSTNGFADTGSSQLSYQPGGLHKPHMVQVDNLGNIYIIETGNHRLQRFTPDGESSGWIGARDRGGLTDGWTMDGQSTASAQPGGFNAPVSLQLVGDSMFIVADNANHRIQKFDIDGHFMGWMGGKTDNSVTSGWELSGLSALGTLPGAFSAPFDARLHGNRLYVADGHNGRLQIFTFE